MKFLSIPAVGPAEWVETEDSYNAIKKGVGGGSFERIVIGFGDLWCDEEFLLKNTPIPVNWTATALVWAQHLGHYQQGTFILGDCIITGGCDAEGNTLGLKEADVDMLNAMFFWGTEIAE